MSDIRDHGGNYGGGSIKGLKEIETFTLDDTLKVGDVAYQVTHNSRSEVLRARSTGYSLNNVEDMSCTSIKLGKYVVSAYKLVTIQSLYALIYNAETEQHVGAPIMKTIGASPNNFVGVRKMLKINETSFYFVFMATNGSTVSTYIQHWTIDPNGVITLQSEIVEAGTCKDVMNCFYIKGTKLYGILQTAADLRAKVIDIVNGTMTKLTDFLCPTKFKTTAFIATLTSNDHFVVCGFMNGTNYQQGLLFLKLTGNTFTVAKDITAAFRNGTTSNGLTDVYSLMESNDGIAVMANYYSGASNNMFYFVCKVDYSTYTITSNDVLLSAEFSDGVPTFSYIIKSWKNTHLMWIADQLLLVTATSQKILSGTQYRPAVMKSSSSKGSFGGVDGNNVFMLCHESGNTRFHYIERPVGLHQMVANSLTINGSLQRVEKVGPNTFVYSHIVNNNTEYVGAFRIETDGSITVGTTVANMGTFTVNDFSYPKLINLDIVRGNDAHFINSHYMNGTSNSTFYRLCKVNLVTLDVTAGPSYSIGMTVTNMMVAKVTESNIFVGWMNTGGAVTPYTYNIDFTTLALTQASTGSSFSGTGYASGDGIDFHLISNTISGANTLIRFYWKANASGTYNGITTVTINTTTFAMPSSPTTLSSNLNVSEYGYAFDKNSRIVRQIYVDSNSYYNYQMTTVVENDYVPYSLTGTEEIFDSGSGNPNRLCSIKGTNIAFMTREESPTSYLYETSLAIFNVTDSFDNVMFVPSFKAFNDRLMNTRLVATDDGRLVQFNINPNWNGFSTINIINPLSVKKAKSQKPIGIVSAINGNKVKIKTFAV